MWKRRRLYSDKDNEFAAAGDSDVPLKLCVSNVDLCFNQCWCDSDTATLSPKPLGGSSAESTGGLQIISCYSFSSTDFSVAKINYMSRFPIDSPFPAWACDVVCNVTGVALGI